MSVPTIFEWLERFAYLQGMPGVFLLLGLALLLFFVPDWRVGLLALLGQYVLLGALFAEVLAPRLAAVKVLAGLFVCLVLYVSARQARWGRDLPAGAAAAGLGGPRRLRVGAREVVISGPLRLFLAAAWILAAFGIGTEAGPLPGAVGEMVHLTLAVVALAGLGVLILALSGDLLRGGMGLLISLAAFDLFYSGVEPALPLLIGLAALSLTVAVAVGYLVQAARWTA